MTKYLTENNCQKEELLLAQSEDAVHHGGRDVRQLLYRVYSWEQKGINTDTQLTFFYLFWDPSAEDGATHS